MDVNKTFLRWRETLAAVPNVIIASAEGSEMSRPSPPAGFFFLTFAVQLLFSRGKRLYHLHIFCVREREIPQRDAAGQGMSCLCSPSSTSNKTAAVSSQAVIHWAPELPRSHLGQNLLCMWLSSSLVFPAVLNPLQFYIQCLVKVVVVHLRRENWRRYTEQSEKKNQKQKPQNIFMCNKD